MKKRRIYHITHVDNLTGIVAEGRLWSDAQRVRRSLSTTNIGHQHIKQRRLARPVPVAARGMLGDYVPFNFCTRSVMLYAIYAGAVQGYRNGQNQIVYLVSTVGSAIATGLPWAFTDRHAELSYAEYFDSTDGEDKIDWAVMPLTYWAGDDQTKEKRQAEFLVHDCFPWEAVEAVVVKSTQTEQQVQAALHGQAHSPRVFRDSSWYY